MTQDTLHFATTVLRRHITGTYNFDCDVIFPILLNVVMSFKPLNVFVEMAFVNSVLDSRLRIASSASDALSLTVFIGTKL